MNSKTTIVAMTIALLALGVAHIPGNQHALGYEYHHGFNLLNLPCIWIHGGHVHCILDTSIHHKNNL